MALLPMSQGPVTIAIVCGYDLDSDLGAYVERVSRRLAGIHLDAIVLSGGHTSPTIDSSEAREMGRHLAELRPHGTVLLEDEAMNTLDNIVFARELIERSIGAVDRFVVCCDVAHVLKAGILANLLLRGRVRMLAVQRRVPLHIWLREPLSIGLETLGAVIPPLRLLLSRAAARLKGVTLKRDLPARPALAAASTDAQLRG
jgi:hypothetical protein